MNKNELKTYKEWNSIGYQVKKGQRHSGRRFEQRLFSRAQVYKIKSHRRSVHNSNKTHHSIHEAIHSIVTVIVGVSIVYVAIKIVTT